MLKQQEKPANQSANVEEQATTPVPSGIPSINMHCSSTQTETNVNEETQIEKNALLEEISSLGAQLESAMSEIKDLRRQVEQLQIEKPQLLQTQKFTTADFEDQIRIVNEAKLELQNKLSDRKLFLSSYDINKDSVFEKEIEKEASFLVQFGSQIASKELAKFFCQELDKIYNDIALLNLEHSLQQSKQNETIERLETENARLLSSLDSKEINLIELSERLESISADFKLLKSQLKTNDETLHSEEKSVRDRIAQQDNQNELAEKYNARIKHLEDDLMLKLSELEGSKIERENLEASIVALKGELDLASGSLKCVQKELVEAQTRNKELHGKEAELTLELEHMKKKYDHLRLKAHTLKDKLKKMESCSSGRSSLSNLSEACLEPSSEIKTSVEEPYEEKRKQLEDRLEKLTCEHREQIKQLHAEYAEQIGQFEANFASLQNEKEMLELEFHEAKREWMHSAEIKMKLAGVTVRHSV